MPGTAGPWTSKPTGGQQPPAPQARAIAIDRHRHSQDRRARRARLFCDAYGLQDRGELVDKILERQRAGRRAIKQAADAGDPAYQRLWDMGAGAGVQRQIGDVLAHRSALQDALT